MPRIELPGKTLKIHESVFLAETAAVMGDVEVGKDSGIWFGAVVRGDVNRIVIGQRTNIQDLSVVHVTEENEAIIGDEVTVGHQATIHACHVGNRVLVGMGAILLDGCHVADDAVIAAGSVVSPNSKIPSGVLAMGTPAKPKRDLTSEEHAWILTSAENYVQYPRTYKY